MEAITYEIMNIIDEQRDMRAVQKANAANIGEKDEFGFVYEPGDCISMNILGFRETAMRLFNEAVETFRLLREYNRHSPIFYQMSAELENIIGQLGSVCITKAVIEQQDGKEDPFLKGLTIDWLRQRVAFNFRKCYSSYMESMAYLNFNQKALHLSLRWAALDKRLIATAEKIEKIKDGKLKIELTTKDEKLKTQAEALDNQKTEQMQDPNVKSNDAAPYAFAPKAHAMPIDISAVKENAEKNSDNAAEVQLKETKASAAAVEASSDEIPIAANPIEANQNPNAEERVNTDSQYDEKFGEDSENNSEISVGKQDKISSERSDEAPEVQNNLSDTDPDEEDTEETEITETKELSEDLPEEPSIEDEDTPPCVLEEFVRRMSELINSPEYLKWPFPEILHSE
ncbi:MAG: hypothetical protein IJI41_12435 [Anaerolineaceae bacterium]|nr:hypothetical protein [Anaerolineaceae bacterium]